MEPLLHWWFLVCEKVLKKKQKKRVVKPLENPLMSKNSTSLNSTHIALHPGPLQFQRLGNNFLFYCSIISVFDARWDILVSYVMNSLISNWDSKLQRLDYIKVMLISAYLCRFIDWHSRGYNILLIFIYTIRVMGLILGGGPASIKPYHNYISLPFRIICNCCSAFIMKDKFILFQAWNECSCTKKGVVAIFHHKCCKRVG
ncbi:hypothetical protein EGR_00187 [Echinococcus granulosus]|uniref:Uncharacterized protein n=1 Tax=Echinococcus granulosus TaxID=6210 RepID=W6UUA2_ECHGR|nr:hypothetical protein EGR_00187 [Echinococcus granulosus]EUB64918.1 hypothetical protein EGR_00187 [Echinococcus granulosus]